MAGPTDRVWLFLLALAGVANAAGSATSDEGASSGQALAAAVEDDDPVEASADPGGWTDPIAALIRESGARGVSDREGRLSLDRTIVVGVPDPAVTGADTVYDGAVRAVIAAMSHEEYTRDRFWLPWEDADAVGAMLFRKGTGLESEWRVVLLVGESAIWGVGASRMTRLSGMLAPEGGPLPIVGPFYTRSAADYELLALEGRTACATSGSVVDGAAVALLNGALGCPNPAQMPAVQPSACARHDLMEDLFGVTAHVVEEGTAAGLLWKKCGANEDRDEGEEKEQVFTVPQGLDPLRRSYESTSKDPVGGSTATPYRFSDGDARDRVWPASTMQEESYQDLSFRRMVRALWISGEGDVLIQGSVPDDVYIVARALHRYQRDVRVVLWAWDHAATHPDLNADLGGSLVLEADDAGQVPLYLARDSAKGVFVATRAAVGGASAEAFTVDLSLVAGGRSWKVYDPDHPEKAPPERPRAFTAVLGALFVVPILAMLRRWVTDERVVGPSEARWLAAAWGMLFVVFSVFSVLSVRLEQGWVAALAGVGALVSLGLTTRVFATHGFEEWRDDRGSAYQQAGVSVVALLVGVGAIGSLVHPGHYTIWRRSAEMFGGVSPVFVLTLSLGFTAWFCLTRARRTRSRARDGAKARVAPLAGVFAVLVVGLLLHWSRPYWFQWNDFAVEPAGMHLALMASLVIVGWVGGTALFELAESWWRLHRDLRDLAFAGWDRTFSDKALVLPSPLRQDVASMLAHADQDARRHDDRDKESMDAAAREVRDQVWALTWRVRDLGDLIATAIGATVTSLVMVSTYPFSVGRSLILIEGAGTVLVVGVGAAILSDLEKDRVLSALGGTAAGRVNVSSHAWRIVELGLIPLALAFSLNNPELVRAALTFLRGF